MSKRGPDTGRKRDPAIRKAKNYSELAKALGVSERTLFNIRKDPTVKKEIPKQESSLHIVSKWVAFLERYERGGFQPNAKEKLRDRLLEIDVERKQHELDERRGKYVDRDLLAEKFQILWSELTGDIERLLCDTLPPLGAAKDATGIAEVNRAEFRRFLERQRAKAERFK
tara:strand:+ start:244 stop:753 length:510 start_codon:yes stop_codon:yes gene_type:complete